MDHTKVDLQQLKAVVCRLIDELIAEKNSSIFSLPEQDFYWKLDAAEKKDMSSTPKEFCVGRLRDDWEMTYWLADTPTKVSVYSLTEVAELLDHIGESVVR